MPTANSGKSHAAQVCFMCKTRKKKCNKVLPCCSYCLLKGLDCVYDARSSHPHVPSTVGGHRKSRVRDTCVYTDFISRAALSGPITSDPSPLETSVYLQVHRLIRDTGQYVDDISVRYFQGLHHHLPIISRTRFHSQLITLGSAPAADFSVLLLSLCLVTLPPDTVHRATSHGTPPPADQWSLRIAARSLFAQVQAAFPPSIHLIQAGLWLAIYEYAQGRPDDAFTLVACCARMAYAASIHISGRQPAKLSLSQKVAHNTRSDIRLESQEAGNTWWGIIIYERIFFCDVTIREQPLVATISGKDARLPTELEVFDLGEAVDPTTVPIYTVSSLASLEIGGFGRAAQATFLLDQVLKALPTTCVDSRLVELDALDAALQTFLAVVMRQCHEEIGGFFCGAIALAIRALFILHGHILSLPDIAITAKFKSMPDWHSSSQAALDTVTKMVIDIADSHERIPSHVMNALPPIYLYIAQAALQHIHEHADWKNGMELRSAEERLQASLEQRSRRWTFE